MKPILPTKSLILGGTATPSLPSDQRFRQGGWLFLISLLIFFISSLLLYGIYAYMRRDDPVSDVPIPRSFLASTGLLILISGLLHAAKLSVRRDRRWGVTGLTALSGGLACLFLWIQYEAAIAMLEATKSAGSGKGLVGMVVVLAILHGLHVLGGVFSLAVVAVRAAIGKYDHERHWAVDFAADYWHFLDLVWLSMLLTFWLTTGGFAS